MTPIISEAMQPPTANEPVKGTQQEQPSTNIQKPKRNRRWRVVLSGVTFMFLWNVRNETLWVWKKGSRSKKQITPSQLIDTSLGQTLFQFPPNPQPQAP